MKGFFCFFLLLLFFYPFCDNSCVYIKITICVSSVGLDRRVLRVTPGFETAVVDICHVQVLSIIWWLVSGSKAALHREVCMHVCECLQCQSLSLTHRGQTNALIRSWHAATTFPSPFFFSFLLWFSSASFFYVSLSLTRTNTFVPISATQLQGTPSELR